MAGVEPSFIAVASGRIAWTGAGGREFPHVRVQPVHGREHRHPGHPSRFLLQPLRRRALGGLPGPRTGAYDDIYLYDTATAAVRQITYNSSTGDWNDWNPRIQADRIVWQKDMLGSAAKPGIYLYDIDMETTSLIIAGAEYRDPDIWGD